MTKIQITPAWKDVKPHGFYVYIHRRSTDGSVFYVGKGTKKRGWSRSRGAFWLNIARKNGVIIEIINDCLTEAEALDIEVYTIRRLKDEGHSLCNLTDGGEGTSGYRHSLAAKDATGTAGGIPVNCSNGMRFRSSRSAYIWLIEQGITKSISWGVAKCAQGRQSSAHGFTWWYDGNESSEYIPPNERRMRPIATECGMCFRSIKDALAHLRSSGFPSADKSALIRSAKSPHAKAYGLKWRYE